MPGAFVPGAERRGSPLAEPLSGRCGGTTLAPAAMLAAEGAAAAGHSPLATLTAALSHIEVMMPGARLTTSVTQPPE